jgi:hypothetical protein
MKRVFLSAAFGLAATMLVACSGMNESATNPTAPTPPNPPSAGVRAIVVNATPMSAGKYQMNAKAEMNGGSSIDVTAASQWSTSAPDLASISSAGVLTALHSGHVDVRATYQNVTGTLSLTLSVSQPPSSFILSGVVKEVAPGTKVLAGVTVRFTSGPNAGTSTTSSTGGEFGFINVPGGIVGLEAVKDGYITWRNPELVIDHDREMEIVMYPTPPKNDAGVTATARCMDGTWSWAQTTAQACTANGGVVYVVCPGPLCQSQ